jgi:hypothetical protein
VALAEKSGKHVELTVVPSNNAFDAIVQTAAQLASTEIVMGQSAVLQAREGTSSGFTPCGSS